MNQNSNEAYEDILRDARRDRAEFAARAERNGNHALARTLRTRRPGEPVMPHMVHPDVLTKAEKTLVQKYSKETCSICIDNDDDTMSQHMLPCGHRFHEYCIERYLEQNHDSCPNCRQFVQKRVNMVSYGGKAKRQAKRQTKRQVKRTRKAKRQATRLS